MQPITAAAIATVSNKCLVRRMDASSAGYALGKGHEIVPAAEEGYRQVISHPIRLTIGRPIPRCRTRSRRHCGHEVLRQGRDGPQADMRDGGSGTEFLPVTWEP